jgi:hypothetical protein
VPHSSHSLFYHPNNTGEKHRSYSSSLCSLLHSPPTSSLLAPNHWRSVFKKWFLPLPNTITCE